MLRVNPQGRVKVGNGVIEISFRFVYASTLIVGIGI